MRKNSICTLCCVALLLGTVAGCSPKKQTETAQDTGGQYPMSLTSTHTGDTSSFKMSNGEICQELVDVTAAYPKFFKDKASTLKLQKLFIGTVLEGNDSLGIEDAVKDYAHSITDQNSMNGKSGNGQDAAADEYASDLNRFVITINITVAYHQHDIITFCKEETVKKDDVASKTHKYYNIDLKTLQVIDLGMFKEENLSDITVLLKQKLMQQNNVTSADALNDLGYFNIDNLSVTSNFSFDENGITWSYLPQELAANANIEPKITLDYDTLKPFAASGSALERL